MTDRFHARSADDGRLEMRGFAKGKLRLIVDHPYLVLEGSPRCQPGDRDVVLTVRDIR